MRRSDSQYSNPNFCATPLASESGIVSLVARLMRFTGSGLPGQRLPMMRCSNCKFAKLAIQFGLFFLCTRGFAGSPTAEPEGLLDRIRAKVMAHLSQLPNYTCHEVVQRLLRRAGYGSMERQDTVELEVAFVGRKELFARPGESSFEEESISKLVPAGTIGNGVFGSHAEAIFSGDAAEFKYIGPSKKDGHKTIRFDFTVSQEKSHFLVKHDSKQGITAYKGSFWVDADTLDPVRMELKADHIPSYIGIGSIQEIMRYTLVKIRNSEFLLPQTAELAASDESGNYTVNMISLEKCQEFSGQSVITFEAPPNGVPSKGSAARENPAP